MARKTRLTPYGEQIVEVFDLDESGSEFTSYRSTPSMAANDGLPSDDPAPLFLSDQAEEPERPGIGKAWDRAVISSRILKTSILVVTAAAIVSRFWEIQSPSLRKPRLRWSASLGPVSNSRLGRPSKMPEPRRRQFNKPPGRG